MRKSVIRLLALLLIALPILGVFANDAIAATSRVATISELKGTVKVKKSGGSKEFTAFAKMSLNEGDILIVGDKSSANLQFTNGTSSDDKMTVAANSMVSFSKLSTKNGTKTKVKLFNGTAWIDVKSIETKADEFTVETPTAIMGVRGTHLFVGVDPLTGLTQLFVGAGIVHTQTNNNSSNENDQRDVYPSDNALIGNFGNNDLNISIATIDLEQLLQQADANIIQAILNAAAEIIKENAQKQDAYIDGIKPTSTDEPQIRSNIDNLIGAILGQALVSGLIDNARMNALIQEVKQATGITIDRSAQLKLLEQQKKELDAQRQKLLEAKQAAEKRQQEELDKRKQQEELMKQLQQKKAEHGKKNDEQKAKQKQKAFEKYESKLSELEKARLLEDQKKRAQELAQANPSPVIIGQTSEVLLDSIDLSYYVYDEIYGHSGHVEQLASITSPMQSSHYTYSIPSNLYYVDMDLTKLATGKYANADVNVLVNGIPVVDGYDRGVGINSVVESDVWYYGLALEKNQTIVKIEVKPYGSLVTASSITIEINRPSDLPSGLGWTTTGIDWNTSQSNAVAWEESISYWSDRIEWIAKNPNALKSFVIHPSYGNSGFDQATLSFWDMESLEYEGSPEEPQVNGMTVSGLESNVLYYFNLEFKNSTNNQTYEVRLILVNMDNGDVDHYMTGEDGFEIRAIYGIENEQSISLNRSMSSQYEARIANEAIGFSYYDSYNSGLFHVVGILNLKNFEFYHYSFVFPIDVGDNYYMVYLIDAKGNSYSVPLKIVKLDKPTGVLNWSIDYKYGQQVQAPIGWTQIPPVYDSYHSFYFAQIAPRPNTQAKIKFEIDSSLYSSAFIWDYYADETVEYEISETSNTIEFNLKDRIDLGSSNLSEGFYRFTLDLLDKDGRQQKSYEFRLLVGERQPSLVISDFKDDLDNSYSVQATNAHEWSVNLEDGVSEVSFGVNMSSNSVGIYVEDDNVNVDYDDNNDKALIRLSNLAANKVYVISIDLYDRIDGRFYGTETLFIHNGNNVT
ncbi:MAG: FecR domain-containing protein [Candidatus Cohnella colombiensis]|uniref:FecR domain-containing protein n=1 Tax=Candidatus Cohnella colombiensis TaxID=3121368 RepID=A0AA95F5U4_9BACL|nr:MAG: FecR domain-containing protein [Cohnella sp.]